MARREPPLSARVLGTAAGALTREPNSAGESTLGDVIADALQTGSVAWGSTVGPPHDADLGGAGLNLERGTADRGRVDPASITAGDKVKYPGSEKAHSNRRS